MSLDARYNKNHDQSLIDFSVQRLEVLEQVAEAAGHGYHLDEPLNAGWVDLAISPDNVRAIYDMTHISTFSPDMVKVLLFEISESRKALAGAREIIANDVSISDAGESLRKFDTLVENIPTSS